MDPFWAAIAEFWWVAPAVIGTGAVGWFGVRRQRAVHARRLAYDAARHELRGARTTAAGARAEVRVARADLARIQAERAAGRASSSDVTRARDELIRAQRDARALSAGVRAQRARVAAARAVLPGAASDPARLPLAQLMSAHDTVTRRWLDYETDPAKLIAFPAVSDARAPLTAVYLTERATAQRLRPRSAQAVISPADFAAYRDAVRRLEATFDAAEKEAWRQARASGAVPPAEAETPAPRWTEVAQRLTETVIASSAEVIARVGDATRSTARADEPAADPAPDPAAARPTPPPPADMTPPPVWPVPSRSNRQPPRP
ncbi:hypothetical protein [uncultured Microbacterium sp.]|uniref:Uncharacterized protein n=1 Tax=uncultured Microbacterium sp. TaxID=191216 RepID=A0A1Y5P2I2_9MICO|nr:hypothetical protein [uncultured Microbacterium sp.]SBS72882.1 conserved hypothetical protein [uncultured Microbacterium sp.]